MSVIPRASRRQGAPPSQGRHPAIAVSRSVRTKIDRLVGGAGEEEDIARVGAGSEHDRMSDSHKDCREPDNISKHIRVGGWEPGKLRDLSSKSRRDVGENIGDKLQIDQDNAAKMIAQDKARAPRHGGKR